MGNGDHEPMNVQVWAPQFRGFGGGITGFSSELAASIAANHDIQLVSKSDGRGCVAEGVSISSVGHWPAPLRSAGLAFKGLWSAIRSKPDLIVSTHLNFGPLVRIVAKLRGVPYVLVAHGIDVNSKLSTSRVRALREADGVIAVSSWTRGLLKQHIGVEPERVSILSNTVDDSRFTIEGSNDLRARYGIEKDARVLLTVARLASDEAYKGYDVVLQCLPRLIEKVGPIHYVIAGKGDELERLRKLVRELDIDNFVTFAGFVPDGELADHYRLADAFAMPSKGEGFGIVFLEAMACGTPVLAGNQDGSVDALGDGEYGVLVSPESKEEVTNGLIKLLSRDGKKFWFDPPQLRQKMLSRFGRPQFARRVNEIVEGI